MPQGVRGISGTALRIGLEHSDANSVNNVVSFSPGLPSFRCTLFLVQVSFSLWVLSRPGRPTLAPHDLTLRLERRQALASVPGQRVLYLAYLCLFVVVAPLDVSFSRLSLGLMAQDLSSQGRHLTTFPCPVEPAALSSFGPPRYISRAKGISPLCIR